MAIAVLNLSRKTILEIVDKVRIVIGKMTGNAAYTTPVPTLLEMTDAADDLELKYQEAENRDKNKKKLMRLSLKDMRNKIRTLTGYVQGASGGDETLILSAGFDIKNPRTPSEILPPPGNVRSVFGKVPGEIILRWAGVKRKLAYKVQINDTPGDESKWQDYTFTGKNRLVAGGLISDKIYAFRVATQSPKGLGNYSDPTQHKAL
jgi:hypothetical protein